MTILRYMARELAMEIGRRSQEFYTFVMPAVDMYEDGNDLVVKIDLPGFKKDEISLRMTDDILSIKTKRKPEEHLGYLYYKTRPIELDKTILLPFSTKDGEKAAATARHADGVITLRIPIPGITSIAVA